ncbi:anaerobic sulfatase maturase [Acetobacterium wieringae]|uniref:anaerobic sulfatase maturase n=1 Tax=Acetobacterium wieringae TaxID=52694 RepID=UPI0026EB629D|nr:anaerobic sulfatase maturase [Acetobacterium wieringae]
MKNVSPPDSRTYAIMAKPIGASCNLSCRYCYYLEKQDQMAQSTKLMSNVVLEAYIRQNLAIHGNNAVVEFAWHGGEPTLVPLDFYIQALNYQNQYGSGRIIHNTLQTNATLLTDVWCEFFAVNHFLIGVSIDGHASLHNSYRKSHFGDTFEQTMAGIKLLQKHGVTYNTLTTVNAINSHYPEDVYLFLRELTDYMQFLPVVECLPPSYESSSGQRFAMPAGIHSPIMKHPLTDFSVNAMDYGDFLCTIFDLWQKMDLGEKYVQIIESTLANLNNHPAGVCVHEALCGHAGVVEMNGDLYSCDRYAFEAYKLGNILDTPLSDLMEKNRLFGMHKTLGLPDECLDCDYIRLCFGGCPKDRLLISKNGQNGKNYLCEGYQHFFEHIKKSLR